MTPKIKKTRLTAVRNISLGREREQSKNQVPNSDVLPNRKLQTVLSQPSNFLPGKSLKKPG
jgi:hypothetical protein